MREKVIETVWLDVIDRVVPVDRPLQELHAHEDEQDDGQTDRREDDPPRRESSARTFLLYMGGLMPAASKPIDQLLQAASARLIKPGKQGAFGNGRLSPSSLAPVSLTVSVSVIPVLRKLSKVKLHFIHDETI